MEYSFTKTEITEVSNIALVDAKGEVVCHIMVDYHLTSAAVDGRG